MTLLVVDLAVPTLSDGSSVGELADKLNDDTAKFVSFFISFAVIGRYWVAHHTYFSALAQVDRGLLGEYFENPLSIVVYAVNVALVSGMEVILFGHAHKYELLERKLPRDVYRYGVAMSLAPVVFFLLSIPVAFVSTALAACCWFLGLPFAFVAERWKPEGADEMLMG